IPEPTAATIVAEVHRQPTEESVILTAVVSKNGSQKARTFLLIIKADGAVKEEEPGYTRNVEVKDQNETTVNIPVKRINVTNRDNSTSKIDKVVFSPDYVEDVVENAVSGSNQATIVIDEPANDPADEIAVEVPADSLAMLVE